MSRQEIMEHIADYFNIRADEDGTYDIDSYSWQSGCYMRGQWLCLAEVVRCVESFVENYM